MQLKPCSCFSCKALPSGMESGVAFCCAPAAGEPHPRAWKSPTLLMQTLWGGSPPEAIRKALPPAEDTFWGLNNTANRGSLWTFCRRKEKGPFSLTQVQGPSVQPPSLQTDSVEWKSTDRTNVFVYGSGKQDCKNTNPSTMMAGTGIGDHIAETDAFYYMKVLTIILLLQKQHLAPVIPKER